MWYLTSEQYFLPLLQARYIAMANGWEPPDREDLYRVFRKGSHHLKPDRAQSWAKLNKVIDAVERAARARRFFIRDRQYVVRDGKVVIIDARMTEAIGIANIFSNDCSRSKRLSYSRPGRVGRRIAVTGIFTL
jgi:hypothetical protein